MRDYGVQVFLGEYLDASLPWLSLCQEHGISFVAHAHGYDVSRRLREPFYRREYLRYREAHAVVTMSRASQSRLIELGLAATATHVIPYGVDVPDVPAQHPARAGLRLLAVGRMVPKKAPIMLLEAFRRATSLIGELRLDHVGAGPLLPAAAQFVAATELESLVRLHGGQDNSTVQRLMRDADVFVQHSMTDPETGDEEGLPVSILEAMAMGLPVVATDHAGISEAVEDGVNGFLVAEGDTRSMAARIEQLARDPELRRSMGQAGWTRAREHFQWARERRELLHVLGLEQGAASPE
jgi:glycosyltransferase involved in cell wall biosynthesis